MRPRIIQGEICKVDVGKACITRRIFARPAGDSLQQPILQCLEAIQHQGGMQTQQSVYVVIQEGDRTPSLPASARPRLRHEIHPDPPVRQRFEAVEAGRFRVSDSFCIPPNLRFRMRNGLLHGGDRIHSIRPWPTARTAGFIAS